MCDVDFNMKIKIKYSITINSVQPNFYKIKNATKTNNEEKKIICVVYRVLLTRARVGIIICAPNRNKNLYEFPEDET